VAIDEKERAILVQHEFGSKVQQTDNLDGGQKPRAVEWG